VENRLRSPKRVSGTISDRLEAAKKGKQGSESTFFRPRVLHHGAMQLLAAKAKVAMKPDPLTNDSMFRRYKVRSTSNRSFTARPPT